MCVNHVFAGQLNHRCCFQRFHVTNRAVLIGTLRDSAAVLASCTAGNRYCSELLLGGPALLMKTGETGCLVTAGTRAAVATGQHAFAGQLIAVHTRLSSANYCTRSATDRFAAVSAFRRSEGQLSERQTTITKGQNLHTRKMIAVHSRLPRHEIPTIEPQMVRAGVAAHAEVNTASATLHPTFFSVCTGGCCQWISIQPNFHCEIPAKQVSNSCSKPQQ
jgi:hypothetical protein